MRARHRISILLSLLSGVAVANAEGASQLTSAPHFLSLADRERIVLFSDGPVAGALANRQADGTVEVVIPRVAVADALAGREFDGGSSADGKLKVWLSSAGKDDVRVRIAPARPVTRVHAYASTNPARLTIDLLHGSAAPERRAEAGAAAAKPVVQAPAPPAASPPMKAAKGAKATVEQTAAADEPARGATAATRGGKSSQSAATVVASNELVGPPRGPASAPPTAAAASPEPSAPGTAVSEAGAAPDKAADGTLVCRWRRTSGVAYCGPDPKAGVYVADLGTANLAGLLDRGRSGPTALPLPPAGPTEIFLNADVTLIQSAKDGWILPAVVAYEQALRAHPEFADAARGRANLALVYYGLGFSPELERMSRTANDPVAPFAGVLLADVWREIGVPRDASPLLASGDRAGGITACLAARVRAARDADAGHATAFPEAFATLAKVCPRTILEDPQTAWLRARAMVLGGEATRGAEALAKIEDELPRRQRALLLDDLAQAYDAAGNRAAARKVEERLAGGSHGRRAARAARVALAARDAAEGKLAPEERRFADLPIEDALQTRERADLIAASELLRGGNEVAALGLMTERKLDARRLAVADQILLARALRRVGLLDQSQRILAGIGTTAPARLPDDYFDELGAQALARDDGDGALAVADQWDEARGETTPIGAVALRARARAAKGDARGATETLKDELSPRDPMLAREVSVELAAELLSADPAVALGLARGALDPSLPPLEGAQAAAALRALAEAAEATGDPESARQAFATLAQQHGGDAAAAGASYRASRLAAAAAAPAQKDTAPRTPSSAPADAPVVEEDPLARRLAAVGQIYDEVIGTASGARP